MALNCPPGQHEEDGRCVATWAPPAGAEAPVRPPAAPPPRSAARYFNALGTDPEEAAANLAHGVVSAVETGFGKVAPFSPLGTYERVPDRATIASALGARPTTADKQAAAGAIAQAGLAAGKQRNDPGATGPQATGPDKAGTPVGAASTPGGSSSPSDPKDNANPAAESMELRPGETDPARVPRGPGMIRYVVTRTGQYIAADPERASELVGKGGRWSTAEDYRANAARSAPITRTGNERPFSAMGQPYHEKLAGLDLSAPGPNSSELPPESVTMTPWGTVHERVGRLLPSQQTTARREYLENLIDTERSKDLLEQKIAAEKAVAERTIEDARIDPLAYARIQAQARMGPAYLTTESATAARQAAVGLYMQYVPLIDREMQLAADPRKTPDERAAHQKRVDMLKDQARDMANLLVGFHVQQFPPNVLSALMASGAFGAGPAGAPAPGGGGT